MRRASGAVPKHHREGNATMADNFYNQRIGMTRFIVPHESFEWYLRGIGVTALATGAILGISSWLYHQRLFQAMGLSELADPAIVEQFTRLSMISTVIIMLTSALYITLMAGFLFHRVAGPVFRMKRHMQSVIDGEQTGELKLRATDQLGDLCVTYNQLLYTLEAIEPKPLEVTHIGDGNAGAGAASGAQGRSEAPKG
jgi:methyl-accepting chemotaxis protein